MASAGPRGAAAPCPPSLVETAAVACAAALCAGGLAHKISGPATAPLCGGIAAAHVIVARRMRWKRLAEIAALGAHTKPGTERFQWLANVPNMLEMPWFDVKVRRQAHGLAAPRWRTARSWRP